MRPTLVIACVAFFCFGVVWFLKCCVWLCRITCLCALGGGGGSYVSGFLCCTTVLDFIVLLVQINIILFLL